ncbi:hypothetical protein DKX38_029410 [Salix brachista]|uniref:HIG1 domain-containing protein n=1 Tax=Salix brachista TaxID=2182728 RepID=A0A5N5J0P3_9ROSI|nr:hypothetical protein DKX38_029410 [Salix brachista]
MEAIQSWVSEHKLASIGTLWAATIGGSLAYTRARTPLSCRMHAQAITLAVLSGAAIYHYYEKQGESAAPEVSTIRSPLSYRSPANFESISTMIFQKPINQAISKPIKYKPTSGNISGKTSAVAVSKKALKAPSVISFTNL